MVLAKIELTYWACPKHGISFVFSKVRYNGSQYSCAISYLHWIVIFINFLTRLKVSQCPKNKNMGENRRKNEEENL